MNAEILADALNRSPNRYREVLAMADYSYWYREEDALIIVMADGANVICHHNIWTVQR